jgi:cytochrome c oxidase subunit 2
MIPSISTYSGDIDFLILLVTVLTGVFFFLAEGMLFWLVWKFRAKPNQKSRYVTGDEKDLKKWIERPHYIILACDVAIIFFAVRVWFDVKQRLPEPDSTIRVIGQQWAWTFQHPGSDNQLDTPDDIFTVDDLYVEVDRTYHFVLESRDVVHSFSIPVFRLKQDAIPGRAITGWFTPTETGDHDLQCAEICGIGHGVMAARIHIQDSQQHAAWIASPAAAQ